MMVMRTDGVMEWQPDPGSWCSCVMCMGSAARWWSDRAGNAQSLHQWHQASARREMTAADLGLPLGQWSVEWLTGMYGARQQMVAASYRWTGWSQGERLWDMGA